MSTQTAQPQYNARPLPPLTGDANKDLETLRAHLRKELQDIARAVRPTAALTTMTDVTLDTTVGTIVVDSSTGARTVTLPDPAKVDGQIFVIKRPVGGTNGVTIAGVVDGATNPTLGSAGDATTIQSVNGVWQTIGTK